MASKNQDCFHNECEHCGKELRWQWFNIDGRDYCFECWEVRFSWMDKSVPTDKRYDRRLM